MYYNDKRELKDSIHSGEPTLAHLLFKKESEVIFMTESKQKILDLCKSAIENLGYELVEVNQGKQYGSPFITFVIDTDKEGGISLDDCELVSKTIDPLLDQTDCFGDAFNLNVSSPGLDRPLKLERDFVKNKNKKIELNFYAPIDGKKKIEGKLLSWDDETVTVSVGSKERTFNKKEISIIKPVIEF